MNLIKQDVWQTVHIEDDLPIEDGWVATEQGNSFFYKGVFYKDRTYQEMPQPTFWLKPIKQVYVFTLGQLGRLIKDALLWYDDTEGSIDQSAMDFLNSIIK